MHSKHSQFPPERESDWLHSNERRGTGDTDVRIGRDARANN